MKTRAYSRIQSAALALVLVMVFAGFKQYLGVGIDLQKERCLKGSPWLFVIVKGSFDFKTGDLLAFRSDERMRDHYPIGTTFIKRIEGIHQGGSGSVGYWVMGDHPKSYDSRYYGLIEETQGIGRAYVLF